jgi:hypothetical protein
MKYKVICGGILKVNGQLAEFGTILDEIELDDAGMRVKEGYVAEYDPAAEKAAEKEAAKEKEADTATDDLLAKAAKSTKGASE